MQTTPNLGLPYPEPGTPPEGDAQIQALAERLDAIGGAAYYWAASLDQDLTPGAYNRVRMNTANPVSEAPFLTWDKDSEWTITTTGLYRVSACQTSGSGNAQDWEGIFEADGTQVYTGIQHDTWTLNYTRTFTMDAGTKLAFGSFPTGNAISINHAELTVELLRPLAGPPAVTLPDYASIPIGGAAL
ncbi:hypothetical protein [Catenulispora pinisilvae]|uniref:hypothetical protein n=1 Tax=Catenulispora pinisilvae TaxID=2705253 RepID=UPI001890FC08|nr:hypothetical protein [Catenulispora pinisilvae]